MALYSIAMNKTKRQQQKEKNKNGRMLMTGLIVGTMVLALVLATVTARSGGGGVQEAKAAENRPHVAFSKVFDHETMVCKITCDSTTGCTVTCTSKSEPLVPLSLPPAKGK